MIEIIHQNNLDWLRSQPNEKFDLMFSDVPYNTGKQMSHQSIKTVASKEGSRVGFGGKTYKTEIGTTTSYNDYFEDYKSFMYPRLEEIYRVLKNTGSFFFMIDDRESHYCKIWLDEIFGRDSFINEIIWAFDFGAKSKKKWSRKHNTIFWYAKDPSKYTFNYEEIDRIPYMSNEGIVSKEKLEKGKIPTDCWEFGDYWFCSIVGTNSKERTGYSTQKPLKILERIVRVHSNPGDLCADVFAGSGSFGKACENLKRSCILVDENPQAIEIMKKQFKKEI